MPTANLLPQNIRNSSVTFSTTDAISGDAVTEPFTVSGPTDTGVIVTNLTTGNKAVIQLTTSTANGASYLKIHYPQPGGNTVFITYASKDSTWSDGYKDFGTSVTTAFKTDLLNWIRNARTVSVNNTTLTRTLTFTAYGINTNQSSAARQFTIVFSGVFNANNTISL
jgi:hypothetical protein